MIIKRIRYACFWLLILRILNKIKTEVTCFALRIINSMFNKLDKELLKKINNLHVIQEL